MKESFEEMQQRLMRESELQHAELRKAIREGLTDEQLESDMEFLQRKGSTRSAEKTESSIPWSYFWDALLLKRIPQTVGVGFAGLATVAVLWFGFRSSPILLQTPSELAKATDQPWKIKLELASNKATFDEYGVQLLAKLDNGNRGANDGLLTFQVGFEGTNSIGERIRFSGSLVLTNAPGREKVRNSKDLSGAWLKGTLKVGTQADKEVNQAFAP